MEIDFDKQREGFYELAYRPHRLPALPWALSTSRGSVTIWGKTAEEVLKKWKDIVEKKDV